MRQFTKLGWLNGKTSKQALPRKNEPGRSFEHTDALRVNENIDFVRKQTEHEATLVGMTEFSPELEPQPAA